MSSLPKADQLYRCLAYPHCGLRLALGQTYSRQQLEDGCEGNAVMLNKLIEKLKNGSILEPIGAWIDSVDDCLAARNVLEFFLLSHGGQASVNDAQQALTTYGCQLSVQSLIKSHCILDGEHVILPGPITPLCEANATTIAKSLFKTISEEALKRAGDKLNAMSLLRKQPPVENRPKGHPAYGDVVFACPFTDLLLATARRRVQHHLDQFEAAGRQPWLICVRNFGRSGNPEQGRWPYRHELCGRGLLEWTLATLVKALGPSAPERVLIFVSHEDHDFTSGRLASKLAGTPWQDRLVIGVKGADLQVRFIEAAFPRGSHFVICDDNITDFYARGSARKNVVLESYDCPRAEDSQLGMLIERAGREMGCANAWGLNPSYQARILVKATSETSRYVGLIYGAFFGLRACHDPWRYTRWGQVADDVERSLRYFHRDQAILRFKHFAVMKAHSPGKFAKGKAGISSASTSSAVHTTEKQEALAGLITDFAAPYCRLKSPNEVEAQGDGCGVVFSRHGKGGSDPTCASDVSFGSVPTPVPTHRCRGKRRLVCGILAMQFSKRPRSC